MGKIEKRETTGALTYNLKLLVIAQLLGPRLRRSLCRNEPVGHCSSFVVRVFEFYIRANETRVIFFSRINDGRITDTGFFYQLLPN